MALYAFCQEYKVLVKVYQCFDEDKKCLILLLLFSTRIPQLRDFSAMVMKLFSKPCAINATSDSVKIIYMFQLD